jgi:hypothetical protein
VTVNAALGASSAVGDADLGTADASGVGDARRGAAGGCGASPDALAAAALTLARRFAAHATLWCVAPAWPSHARHVAVEFVHPVIVGKRALPAVHVGDADATATVRLLARPGDVLLVIGPDGGACTDLLLRAGAWGLETVVLGAGPRPTDLVADHEIWLADVDPASAARAGDVVLCYHLLWELTHVVFEHPGLLQPEPECTDDVCITCSDEGRVAEVVEDRDPSGVEVLAGGRSEVVDASLVGPLVPGDLVLVHAGVILTTLPALSGSRT